VKLVGALVVVAVSAFWASDALAPRSAAACTLPANFDAVAASDLIVEGRVVGWTELAESQISYEVDVVRTFKGANMAGQTITIKDFGSRLQGGWEPTGGLCGTFPGDPTGVYIVVGLRGSDGDLRSTNQTRFFLGEDPEGPAYEQAIQTVGGGSPPPSPGTNGETVTATAPLPPDTGSEGGGGSGVSGGWLWAAAGVLVVVFGAGAWFVARQRSTSG
jgi:hypothetical protein